MDDQWVEVLNTYDVVEADMVVGMLSTGGIEARKVSMRMSPYPVAVGGLGEVKVYVMPKDEADALDLIENIQSD